MSNEYDDEEYNDDFVEEEEVAVVTKASGLAPRRSPSSSRSRTPLSPRSRRSSSASSRDSRYSKDSRDSRDSPVESPKKGASQPPPAAIRTSSHTKNSQSKTISTIIEATSETQGGEYSDDEDFEYTAANPPPNKGITTQSQQPQHQQQKQQPPLNTVNREPSYVVRRGHAQQQEPASRGSETGDVEFIVGKAPRKVQSTVYRSGLSNAGSSHTSSVGKRVENERKTCDDEDASSNSGGSPKMSQVASFTGGSPTEPLSPASLRSSGVKHSPQREKSVSVDQQQPRSVATAPPPATRVASTSKMQVSSDSESDAVNPSSSVMQRKAQNKNAALPSMPSAAQPVPTRPVPRQPHVSSAPAAPPPDPKAYLRKPVRDPVAIALKEPQPIKEKRQRPPPPAAPSHGGRISKELQRMIQLRDHLRHEVADLSSALESFQSNKEDRSRLRFFEIIEAENQELASAVKALKVGVTSQVTLSDRLAQLAREISNREKDLKDVQRDLRKVIEETKHLSRAAGGDDQTAIHDEFVKRKEELITLQEGQRLRQQRQLEELSLAYQRALQNTLTNEGKIIEVGYEVSDHHVSTMEQSEYQALLATCEANKKKLSRLKQAVAGIEYQYEPPAQIVEWQEKKAEDAFITWEGRAQQLLKQIKHRESTIMTNFGLLERPEHFADPNDETSIPTISAPIVPPPLPAPPKAKPQIVSTQATETPAARKQPGTVSPQLSPRKPNQVGGHKVRANVPSAGVEAEGNEPANAPVAKPAAAAPTRKNRNVPPPKKEPARGAATPRLASLGPTPHLASPEYPDRRPRRLSDSGADEHRERVQRMEEEEQHHFESAVATPPARSLPGGEVVDNEPPGDEYGADYEEEDEIITNAHHHQQSSTTSSAYYDGGATTQPSAQPSYSSGPTVQHSPPPPQQQEQHVQQQPAQVQPPSAAGAEEEIPPWLMD
ncbi:Hypothetical protein, putative [Bodo saltans]|uniref:Uncharacterized protein n=1 Tax=Bodo saltans TaxID=75058 RepID=A0A0S4JKE0_BODSA|nr:Hypothetical protein, putative [Bodo saltans]|eukprot:CUG90721.1 Hypothetical protein, putative [Bodo saltans]